MNNIDIKTKDKLPKSVKSIDKTIAWTERIKDPLVYAIEKVKDFTDGDIDIIDYGEDKIKYYSNRIKDESLYASKKSINKSKDILIDKYKKKKLLKHNKDMPKEVINNSKKTIKTSKNVVNKTNKTIKNSKRVVEQGRKLAIESTKKTVKGIKVAVKATVSAIKGIIAGVKSLIAMIAAGGSLAAIVILVICLIGLLATSIFGIFLSSEKTSSNSITMNDVVRECNKDFSNKLESIQNSNIHDEYVLEGNMASWKDILLTYTIRQSNGINEKEVITLDDSKKKLIKDIFWDMNEITYSVKTEKVESSSVNTNDLSLDNINKKVLHINIKSKTAEDMKLKYNYNPLQIKQYNELLSDKYSNLWNGVIYGRIDSGEYVNWRQKDPSWSSIKMGNSSGTIGSIGCLVTSISILIEKSGVNTLIQPFNPGTFVEELNKHGGFDSSGNLSYSAVNKAVPGFKYAGNVNLRNKSKDEKLLLIKQYLDNGYFITAEVKGATPGHQHWVAVTSVDDTDVIMVDPASEQTVMWNAYNYTKTSQFNYFKIET